MCSLRTLPCALFACVCIFSLTSGSRAQTYTPVPYNFPAAPEDPGSSGSAIAANGYGLWTSNYEEWELDGYGGSNGQLATGSDNHDITNCPQTTKVAANLRGSVRYVCVNNANNGFIVSGFDDAQCGGVPHQISLNIPYSSSDNLFHDTARQSVITGGEYIYATGSSLTQATTQVYGEPGGYSPQYETVGNPSAGHCDQLPIDWDIAIDGHYLYIVWYHYESQAVDPGCWYGDEIFVTCVDLATCTKQTGFPAILHIRPCGTTDNTGPGCGTQPTVACDVRNNSSGTPHPACEIAYIDDYGHVNHWNISPSWPAPGRWVETLPSSVITPADPSVWPYSSTQIVPFTPAVRARILVASSGSGMQNDVIGYYVIAGNTQGALFYFDEVDGVFKPGAGTSYGWYVDGASGPTLPPEAAPVGGNGQTVDVPDNQIVALANPYDGENDGNFDEFHCVYTINHGPGLMIVRGADNGVPWPTSPFPYHIDTRSVLNNFNGSIGGFDPDGRFLNYCAAANQAGIHVLWVGADATPDYMRDRRNFDEPIEENTILSFDNYIADGSSTGAKHGGTVGAQTKPGKTILVWTDPALFYTFSTPADNTHAWIYFGNASTGFYAKGAGLTIGTASSADALATLTVFPNFACQFLSPPLTSDRNYIQVSVSGICNYYSGTPPFFQGYGWINEVQDNFRGGGDFRLNGNLLNIMPGCNFAMTNDSVGFPRLISSHGTIVSEYGMGADLHPEDNGFANIGGAIIFDTATLWSGALLGAYWTNLLTLNGVAHCPFITSFINSTIKDTSVGGQALVYLNDPLTEVDFYRTAFTGGGLGGSWADHETDSPIPSRPLSVTYCSFDRILQQGIHLTSANTGDTADYYLLLDYNDFRKYLAHGADGILLEDFQTNIPGDLALHGTPIDISSNTFDTASSFGDNSKVEAAIHLRNTSAVVALDTIDGERADSNSTYGYGILLDLSSAGVSATKISDALLCSNKISHVGYPYDEGIASGAGIATSYWKGYEKMNNISHSAQGSIFGTKDAGAYLMDTIHDNQGPGINNTADYASGGVTHGIEMRGLIHTTDDYIGDMAGFNIIQNNNLDLSPFYGEIAVADGVTLHVGNEKYTGSSSVAYGKNSIIQNGHSTDWLVSRSYGYHGTCYIGADAITPDNALDTNLYTVNGSPYVPAGASPDAQFPNMSYNSTADTVHTLTSITPPSIACYGSRETTKKGGEKPTAEAGADTATTDECQHLDNVEYQLFRGGEYLGSYDTIKAYITLCYNQPFAWGEFSNASDDVDGMTGSLTKYDEFREWLKSVLYLRTDSSWYCADVYTMLSTFHDFEGHGVYPNGAIAVERYILDNNRCDSEWSAMFAADTAPEAYGRIQDWRDTVKDSLTEPRPDTTIPSIDSIGLSILRGAPAGVVPTPIAPGAEQFSGLDATENPFTQSTAIKFTLADYGLVTFQLFDVLGHAVTTNGIGQVLYPGEHEFDIDGSKLAPGNYIARVAFHNGDVESIMVERK